MHCLLLCTVHDKVRDNFMHGCIGLNGSIPYNTILYYTARTRHRIYRWAVAVQRYDRNSPSRSFLKNAFPDTPCRRYWRKERDRERERERERDIERVRQREREWERDRERDREREAERERERERERETEREIQRETRERERERERDIYRERERVRERKRERVG